MNKYLIIGIILAVILAGGGLYRTYLLPEEVEINRGDRVKMTVINEDIYDHGIAIDAFGISQRMPANSTIVFEFVATQAGDFQYYCSVPCGEGDTDKGHRTHFDMIGTITVKNIVTTE